MANRTISTNQLAVGTQFLVDGVVSFSRVTSKIEGEELARDIQRRRSRGWIPVERPYTTITISNAQVRYKDPNNKLPEEIYAEESLYTSTRHTGAGFFFTGQNRGNSLPWIGERQGKDGGIYQFNPEGELANGLHVTLVLKVFKGKPNNGVSLEGVIVNEPVCYYDMSQAGAGLEQFGLTFHPAPTPTVTSAKPEAHIESDNNHTMDNEYPYEDENYQDKFSSQPLPQQFQQPQNAGMPFNQNGAGIVYNPQSGNRNY